jgi:hypothetical protein
MEGDLNFHYLISIPEENLVDASWFRGFGSEIIRISHLIGKIIHLPAHPLQFVWPRETVMQHRMMGAGRWILPLHVSALTAAQPSPEQPLYCVVSTPETFEATAKWAAAAALPVLHVSTHDDARAISVEKVTHADFRKHAINILGALNPSSTGLQRLRKELKEGHDNWPPIQIGAEARYHGVTVANEFALESFGYQFLGSRELRSTRESEYIDAIIESAQRVVDERQRVINERRDGWFLPPTVDLILAAPAMFRQFHTGKAPWNADKKVDSVALRDVLRAFSQQDSYMTNFHPSLLRAEDGPVAIAAVSEYLGNEARAFNTACAVRAVHTLSPVLRIPPRVNRMQDDLHKLGSSARAAASDVRKCTPQAIFKMHRLARALGEKLQAAIPQRLMDFIRKNGRQLKIISDAPLEFLPVDGLPLAMRYETSRIPATPANLMLQQCLVSKRLMLPAAAFDEMLVIRSFRSGDIVGKMLPAVLEMVRREGKNRVKIKQVDVSSPEEFVRACNDFAGALMIFDGHGSHAPDKDVGSIAVGEESLDVWSLRGKIQVPPIVILSACDTHPPDRSHASTAAGFLNLGARTVLGTFLPVDAPHGSVFLARLLLRLEEYLPAMTGEGGECVTWSDMMWSLLRMMYITELLRSIVDLKFADIAEAEIRMLMTQSNHSISRWNPHWWEKFIDALEIVSGKKSAEISEFIQKHHQLPEAMKYVQLGNPEQIVITSEKLNEVFASIAEN